MLTERFSQIMWNSLASAIATANQNSLYNTYRNDLVVLVQIEPDLLILELFNISNALSMF